MSLNDFQPSAESFGRGGNLVTPDDDTDLTTPSKGIYVVAAGVVSVITTGGDTITSTDDMPAGHVVPYMIARVLEATTATVYTIED